MSWILRLVKTGAEGEGQATDVMEIDRPEDLMDITNLGLTLSEAKQLLAALQQEIVAAQVRTHCARRPNCPCGRGVRHVKDYRKHAIATLFGQVAVQLPRFRCTACDAIEVGIEWPSHCRSTPELDRLQAHLSALMTYRTAADILEQMFPAGVGKDKETMRRHTLFTKRMGRFLTALLKRPIRFVFPRIWFTKGETLKAYTALPGSDDWRETRSCWQNARHCSLDGNLVQCGVCAACMLRRMSIHSAGLADDDSAYACSDLHAATFEDSMQLGFHMRGRALREYAIAGAQHLDHMADLVLPLHRPALRRHAVLVAQALDKPVADVETELVNVIERHAAEWNDFLQDKGARSFLRQWTRA